MTKHLLDRTPIESTVYAVGISITGLCVAAGIAWRYVSRAVDAAFGGKR